MGKDMGPCMGHTWTWEISNPAIASPTFSGPKPSRMALPMAWETEMRRAAPQGLEVQPVFHLFSGDD